jgi:hypothetical protein
MGWYAATDGSVRSRGTMYFALHPHGQWGAVARDADTASAAIADLKSQEADVARADV